MERVLIMLIRMKMDHSMNRNFSFNIGVTSYYLNNLFNGFQNKRNSRLTRIKFNTKYFMVISQSWRFRTQKKFYLLIVIEKCTEISRMNLLNVN